MSPDPDLDRAYRRARYRVFGPGGVITLQVGRHEPALATILCPTRAQPPGPGVRRDGTAAALITACNPHSRLADPATNDAAEAALVSRISAAALPHFRSVALDPDGQWPAEPGLLILGIERRAAVAVARDFGQNALLWIDARCIPELVWTEGP